MIPFESLDAQILNAEMFETIKNQSLEASKKAAKEMGEPPMKGAAKGGSREWLSPQTLRLRLSLVKYKVLSHSVITMLRILPNSKALLNNYLEKLLEEKVKIPAKFGTLS